MRDSPLRTLALLGAAIALSLALVEAAVRAVMRRDGDGQEWVRELRLRPYRLPLPQIAATLASIERGESFLTYDPDLGWVPRPHARSADGLRRVDRNGIRADGETSPEPPPGVLRIAIFGDSFTFGDEVPLADTWGALLERDLAARGTAAEVLNFGVNAYGMDQAYLRWRKQGRVYRPSVVVYGFQPENVLRNVNVLRPFYFASSEIPLSKPRFVVGDDALSLVNVPAIPPDRILAALRDGDPRLLAHDRFWAALYQPHWWLESKTVALVATLIAQAEVGSLRLDRETEALATRITAEFARDAAERGAAFVVVHLPRRDELAAIRGGAALWYQALLSDLDARYTVVHPERALETIDESTFAPGGHYAAPLNRIVAAALVEPVLRASARGAGAPP